MFEQFEKYAEKTFVGFCSEPEIKSGDNGTIRCNFSIPLSTKKNDDNTVWLNCVAYNDIAEAFAEVCQKGCQVKVSGKFFQYEYNANVYTKFYVRDFLKLADPKPRNDNDEV